MGNDHHRSSSIGNHSNRNNRHVRMGVRSSTPLRLRRRRIHSPAALSFVPAENFPEKSFRLFRHDWRGFRAGCGESESRLC
jgi:hypothetical protein